ncbi:hypothetical protein AU255_09225 [Methyloprofundus sedimenti]|uniref:Peptidase S49 domain-containing protein n=1 Tax=Methyloprofundus sedimenti TaxID=1420851 RepID=A0A1V8M8Z5_9GAMM|nr:S49 family peptidase [Methyloprofundus sedimenti]OQK18019.1 hypothetical protein AU255_09225 [Methyloprofundus sedimenti]
MLNETIFAIRQGDLQGIFDLEAKLLAAGAADAPTPTGSTIEKVGNTVIIPITGVLFRDINILTLFGYGTALSSIQNQLYQAVNDSGVSKIILTFDSPGGAVNGIHELANTINDLAKPCSAYVTGTAASAAFWLAAACNEIIVDKTAVIGSVGIVSTYQKNGSKSEIEIVSSHAQDKLPNAESEQGRATILKTLNAIEAVFISSLTTLRPVLTKEKITGENGGVLVGANAVNAGFADSTGSLQALISGLPKNKTLNNDSGNQAGNQAADHGWNSIFANVNSTASPEKTKNSVWAEEISRIS